MLIEERTELPRITRFVRAAFLCGVEGLSVGFALATLVFSSQLVKFVKTNRIDAKLRKEMLAVILTPAFLLPLVIVTLSLASAHLVRGRLSQMEQRIRILAPLCGLGFAPLLMRPSLWSDQALAFLMVTGVFASVVTLTVRVSALACAERHGNGRRWKDLESVRLAVSARLSPRLFSIVAVLAILVLVFLGIMRSLHDTNLAGTAIQTEWATVRRISESSGIAAWLGPKGWRISGHLGVIGALYALTTTLVSRPEGLLLLRLLGATIAAVPLFLWSKRSLGTVPSCLVSVGYLSMPLAGMLQLRDTFPVTVALGVFFLGAYYLESGRIGKGLTLVLIGIGLGEQVALWFALFGAYLTRSDSRKSLGKWLTFSSLGYFLFVALYALPHFGVRTYGPDTVNRMSIGVQNLGLSLTSLLANPEYTLSRWFEVQSLEFWLALTVPLAMLPLRGKNWLLWLSPVVLFACSATTQDTSSQWRDPVFAHFLAMGFLALIATLQTLKSSSPELGSLRMRTALLGWAMALLPSVAMFGAAYYKNGP